MALDTEGEQYKVISENYSLRQHVENLHKPPLVANMSRPLCLLSIVCKVTFHFQQCYRQNKAIISIHVHAYLQYTIILFKIIAIHTKCFSLKSIPK